MSDTELKPCLYALKWPEMSQPNKLTVYDTSGEAFEYKAKCDNNHRIEIVALVNYDDANAIIEQLRAENERLKSKYDNLKNAVEYHTILWEFTLDEENPRETLKQLLDIETAVMIDPKVSSAARELEAAAVERAISEVLDECAKRDNYRWDLIAHLLEEWAAKHRGEA